MKNKFMSSALDAFLVSRRHSRQLEMRVQSSRERSGCSKRGLMKPWTEEFTYEDPVALAEREHHCLEGWAKEVPPQVSIIIAQPTEDLLFLTCRITTFIWRHILVLAYIWSYYFICVCPAVLLSCNICHLLKGGDLAGFIHMDAAFLHFSPLFLNENTWPLAVRLRLSNITSGGLKYARTVHFAVCCFCHHEEELPLTILEPSKGTRMGRNHPS